MMIKLPPYLERKARLKEGSTELIFNPAQALIKRTWDIRRNDRKQKLLRMAAECASYLKIHHFDVIPWPPEQIPKGIVQILASSTECDTASIRKQVAIELSGEEHEEQRLKFVAKKAFGWDDYAPYGDVDAVEVFSAFLNETVDQCGSKTVLETVRSHPMYSEKGKNLFPLWTVTQETLRVQFKWSTSLMECYEKKSYGILQVLEEVRDRKAVHSRVCSFNPFRELIVMIIDALATAQVAQCYGITLYSSKNIWQLRKTLSNFMNLDRQGRQVSEAAHFGEPRPQSQMVHLQALDIAVQCLTAFLTKGYTSLLESKLRERKTVGKCTNFLRLRSRHLWNQVGKDEDNSFCAEFDRSLVSSLMGADCLPPEHGERDRIENIDCLRIMCKVLDGHVRQTTSVQLSMVQQELKDEEVERTSFLGKISKGHVRLLECGNDTALIIPYLNKVLLRLDDKRWLRDADIQALAPFDYCGDYSEVRRAATILMAYDIPDGARTSVNEESLRILKRYARKGELYSTEARLDTLSSIKLDYRISGWGIGATAEDVFRSKPDLIPFLFREMVHDRLMMKSDFSKARLPLECDAYYDAFYLKLNMNVRNNINWAHGVPMSGITWNAGGRAYGFHSGLRVEGVSIGLEKAYRRKVVLWASERTILAPINGNVFLSNPELADEVDVSEYEHSDAARKCRLSPNQYLASYFSCAVRASSKSEK